MDDLKVGTIFRSVRRRRRLRQADVAELAHVGQWTISRVERGHLARLSVGTVRRVAVALEIALPFQPRWRGGELPRLIDRRHAGIVDEVVRLMAASGWEVALEYTFSHFFEKGSVDVLGWRPDSRALLIVEVKSEIDNLQEMLSILDRKTRLVPGLVAADRGWRAEVVGAAVVLPEGSTSRDAVARHGAIFGAALPHRTVQVRHWLERPDPRAPLRAVWFLRFMPTSPLAEKRGGSRRVTAPKKPA